MERMPLRESRWKRNLFLSRLHTRIIKSAPCLIDVDAHTYTMLDGYNILGYWDFDALEVDPETGVITVEDAIQGKDGVLKNFDLETALTNGADGKALDFGSTDDRVDIPSIGESSEEATFAFWVFRRDGGWRCLLQSIGLAATSI